MAWLAARKFDVYIVDSSMSGASALGICCTIRAVDKEGAVICLIADQDDREPLLTAGADLVLEFPHAVCKLGPMINDLVDSPASDSVH